MRDIKFRAWQVDWKDKNPDSPQGRMFYPTKFSVSPIGTIEAGYHMEIDNYLESKILMQFTGLVDKNGKEIYEGDIFNCLYYRDGHKDHVYSVIFNEFSAAFEFQRYGPPCTQYQVSQHLRDHAGQWGKIIGNIYENPDLLAPLPKE